MVQKKMNHPVIVSPIGVRRGLEFTLASCVSYTNSELKYDIPVVATSVA